MGRYVTAKQISRDTGFRSCWISARFSHLAEDALADRSCKYDIDVLISYCREYRSHTRNPVQKAMSESMLANLARYLEGLK